MHYICIGGHQDIVLYSYMDSCWDITAFEEKIVKIFHSIVTLNIYPLMINENCVWFQASQILTIYYREVLVWPWPSCGPQMIQTTSNHQTQDVSSSLKRKGDDSISFLNSVSLHVVSLKLRHNVAKRCVHAIVVKTLLILQVCFVGTLLVVLDCGARWIRV